MNFEWDPRKAAPNLRKHGVSFLEAGTVFGDQLAVTVHDPDHSDDEERFIIVEWSSHRRLLIVSYTERGERIRIISARELTKAEGRVSEEEI